MSIHRSDTSSGWCVAFNDTKEKKIFLVEEGDEWPIELHIERHVVPYVQSGDEMLFGVHDFTRQCVCRPRIEHSEWGGVVIIHWNRKPN